MWDEDQPEVNISDANEGAKDGEVGRKASVLEASWIPAPKSSPYFLCNNTQMFSNNKISDVSAIDILIWWQNYPQHSTSGALQQSHVVQDQRRPTERSGEN